MKLYKEIREYILDNIEKVPHPTNSTLDYNFGVNLKDLIQLFFKVMDYDDVDISIKRCSEDFEKEFQVLYNFDVRNLSGIIQSVEELAANFEAFLKLLAYINPTNRVYWLDNNDPDIQGIRHTMLDDLINGKILKKKNVTGNKFIPIPLVKYDNTTQVILDYLRKDIRNSLHISQIIKNRLKIQKYCNLVIGCYLIAVETNYHFLNSLFSSSAYITKLLSKLKFSFSDHIDLICSEVKELSKQEIAYDIDLKNIDSFNRINMQIQIYNVGKEDILEVKKRKNQFILTSQAGYGKTTTLKHLASVDANSGIHIPFFYELKNFENDVISEIGDSSSFSLNEIESFILDSKAFIYLDGVDEINIDVFDRFKSNLRKIIDKYPNINLVLSIRDYLVSSALKEINFSVYELLPLNRVQIMEYINKHIKENFKKDTFSSLLCSNEYLYKICTNIFILEKYVYLINKSNNDSIPDNIGLLIDRFIALIIENEINKPNTISLLTMVDFYSLNFVEISSFLKMKQKLVFSIHEIQNSGTLNYDLISQTISFFVRIGILIKINEKYQYNHSLYQEYFCAKHLKNKSNSEIENYIKNENWIESIIILYDLSMNDENADELFTLISEINPYLASKCLLSTKSQKLQHKEILINKIKIKFKDKSNVEVLNNCIHALAELNESSLLAEILIGLNRTSKYDLKIMNLVTSINTEKYLVALLKSYINNGKKTEITLLLNSLRNKGKYLKDKIELEFIAKELLVRNLKNQMRLLIYISDETLDLDDITLEAIKKAVENKLTSNVRLKPDKYFIQTAIRYKLFDNYKLVEMLSKRKNSIYAINTIIDTIKNDTDNSMELLKIAAKSFSYLLLIFLSKQFKSSIGKIINSSEFLESLISDSDFRLSKQAVFFNKTFNIISNEELVHMLYKTQNPLKISRANYIIKKEKLQINEYAVQQNDLKYKLIEYMNKNIIINKKSNYKFIRSIVFSATGNNISDVFNTIKNKTDWLEFLLNNKFLEVIENKYYRFLKIPTLEEVSEK